MTNEETWKERWGKESNLQKLIKENPEIFKSQTEDLLSLVHLSDDDKIEDLWDVKIFPFHKNGDLLFTREKLLFLNHPFKTKGFLSFETIHDHYNADLVLEVPYDDIKKYELKEHENSTYRKTIETDLRCSLSDKHLLVVLNDDVKDKYPINHFCTDKENWHCDMVFELTEEKYARMALVMAGKLMSMYRERRRNEERKIEITKYEVTYDMAKLVESKLFEFGDDGGLLTHCPYCKTKNPQAGKEKIVECSGCGEKYIAPKKILELL